jgi:hypothetical protein
LTLRRPIDPGEFPFKEYKNTRPNVTIGLSFIDSKGIPAIYQGLLADTATIDVALKKRGAQVLDITNGGESAVNDAIDAAFTIPADFGKDPKERLAISTLEDILMPKHATTKEATTSP